MDRITVAPPSHDHGFGILEGMLAAAVVGIGFIAILQVTAMATQTLMVASDQDKLTMLTTMMLEEIAQDSINLSKYHNVNLIGTQPTHARGKNKMGRWTKRFASFCGKGKTINQCISRATVTVATKCKDVNGVVVSSCTGNTRKINILTLNVETTKGPGGGMRANVARTFNGQ